MDWIFSNRSEITDPLSFLRQELSKTCAEYLLVQGITPDAKGYEVWKRSKKKEILVANRDGDIILQISDMPIAMFMENYLQADTMDGESYIVEKRVNARYEFLSEENVVSKSSLLPISSRFKRYILENAKGIKDVRHLSLLIESFASNVCREVTNTGEIIRIISNVLSESSIGIKLSEFEIESIIENSRLLCGK